MMKWKYLRNVRTASSVRYHHPTVCPVLTVAVVVLHAFSMLDGHYCTVRYGTYGTVLWKYRT